jgi:GNAT superfamily N-acetyltransferase
MITYQTEKFGDVLEEFKSAYMLMHYEDLASNRDSIPLDPDFDKMFWLESQDKFHIVTARDDGKLIGYHSAITDTGLNYKSTWFAFTHIYYLDKEYRGGRNGLRLLQAAEKQLDEVRKAKGVAVMDWSMPCKVYQDHSNLFEKALNFTLREKVFRKLLK